MAVELARVEEIFATAVTKTDAAERAAYLDEACAGDAELRARAEALLAAHDAASDFLKLPGTEHPTVTLPRLSERPGTKIGPYKLLQQIGEGGMGVVFMAEQQEPVRRKTAVKIIKPGLDSRHIIARFEAERQALAMMDHPHIAKVLDAGSTDSGRSYFAMDLVKGLPITEYCDARRLTPRGRLELFIPVCDAVQHAHQKGIIHRDLKPSNVLVAEYDDRPMPKVIDFGVAKALSGPLTEQTMFTQFGQIIGTFEYMSPEQATFNQLDVDTRSDIYSLGVLLYELLAGSTPFDKSRFRSTPFDEVLRIIREEEPPRPSTRLSSSQSLPTIAIERHTEPARLKKELRGELDWIVMKCLEKDRNRRYETASSLARDIERYLHDEPVQACPPSAIYRLRKLARRNKRTFAAASMLALALLLALVVLSVSNARITGERNQRDVALEEKAAALETARASEREAQDQLFLALFNQAKAHRQSRQIGQRVESLAALTHAADIRMEDGLRDQAIAAMALPDVRLGPARQITIPGRRILAFDSQYQRYASLDEKGAVSVRSLADDREIQCLVPDSDEELGPVQALWFSPDGMLVAASAVGGTLRVWRVTDGQLVLVDTLGTSCVPAFSRDSRHMAIGQNDWVICYDLTTGQESIRWQLSSRVYDLEFDPDGQRLAVAYYNSSVVSVYDAAAGGAHLVDLPVGPDIRQVVAWHPDGNRLAVSGADPRIQIWDVSAGRKLATLEGHVQDVSGLAFHPDGAVLVSTSWDGVVRLWDVATGRPVMQIPIGVSHLQFSDDGRWFGVNLAGQQIQLLELVPAREYRTFVSGLGAGQGTYYECAYSPDGRLLAVGFDDGVRLWDVVAGKEVAFLPGQAISVHFQPDGSLLACGRGGLYRWPIRQSQHSSQELHVGPAHSISLPFVPHRIACSADGEVVAVVSEASGAAVVVNLPSDGAGDSGSVHVGPTLAHAAAGYVALSCDGRWMATAGWHSEQVRLWDAHANQMVHEWTLSDGHTQVFFTRDSQSLILAREHEFSFWDIERLQPIRRIPRDVAHYPGQVCFSPDGLLMALEMAPGVIHLKDVATARTVARLEDPFGDRAVWMEFSPDGAQLAVVALYAHAVHIWDLRAIRTQLTPMGLDWDWPPFPAIEMHKTSPTRSKPALRVEVHDDSSSNGAEPDHE